MARINLAEESPQRRRRRRFKLLMKIQQNQKKSVKITCFLTKNIVYLRSGR